MPCVKNEMLHTQHRHHIFTHLMICNVVNKNKTQSDRRSSILESLSKTVDGVVQSWRQMSISLLYNDVVVNKPHLLRLMYVAKADSFVVITWKRLSEPFGNSWDLILPIGIQICTLKTLLLLSLPKRFLSLDYVDVVRQTGHSNMGDRKRKFRGGH